MIKFFIDVKRRGMSIKTVRTFNQMLETRSCIFCWIVAQGGNVLETDG
jgi:hypothetical protein